MFAIDAQVSPMAVGGTETHVPLQIDALARHSDERFLVIGLADQSEELRPLIGSNMELMAYPGHYAWYRPGAFDRWNPSPGWRRLMAAAGPWRGLVREAVRRRFEPDSLSAAQNDALLRPHGVKAIHFPYPQYFETRLPMIYEPWGLPHRNLPQTFQPGEPSWIDNMMRHGCEKAAMVIVATRWVKRDLIAAYGLAPEKIAVLPRNPVFQRPPELDQPDAKIGELPEVFALCPGAAWPHKNHVGLLRGMARLRDQHGLKLQLVCTGRTQTTAFPAIKQAIAELGLKSQVRFLGRVSRRQLDDLFRRATFLAHPSKFEGLGLPLVEAMQMDLPIVAAAASSIPEVVADAAILFDPDNPDDIAEALKRALQTPAWRDELRQRGRRRLAEYFPSHEGLAARFVAVYRRAAGLALDAADAALLAEMTA